MTKTIYKTVFFSGLVATGMFAFSFASAPLYNMICQKTQFSNAVRITGMMPDLNREVTVQFVAMNNQNLPWQFGSRTTSVTIHPGENTEVLFYAKNNTQKIMTVQAIPSFAPPLAANYFHKIQCFCFNRQTLKPGESINMPVIFRIDTKLPKTIHTITLAYTLFDLTDKLAKRTIS